MIFTCSSIDTLPSLPRFSEKVLIIMVEQSRRDMDQPCATTALSDILKNSCNAGSCGDANGEALHKSLQFNMIWCRHLGIDAGGDAGIVSMRLDA